MSKADAKKLFLEAYACMGGDFTQWHEHTATTFDDVLSGKVVLRFQSALVKIVETELVNANN